jgi:cytochrome P450
VTEPNSLVLPPRTAGLSRPPGPKGMPWLGPLVEMSGDTLGFLRRFGREYGPIAHTRIGPIHLYMLCEPALIEELLLGRHSESAKDATTRGLTAILGEGLITSNGALWKRQRRMASPAMRPKSIAGYGEAAVSAAERLTQRLPDCAVRNVYADMMAVLVDIVSTTLLGFDATDSIECLHRIANAAVEYTKKESFGLYQFLPAWIPARHRRIMRSAANELDEVVYRVIARCREQPQPANHYIAQLCNARDQDGQPMDLQQLRDEAATILVAAHETSALGLAYTLHCLSENPAVVERLRAELHSVLGERRATVSDLPRLVYLNGVVREMLRLYPSVYVFGREIIAPIEIAGYHLPVGSRVMMSPYVVQRDPRFFRDPERFVPERWIDLDRSTLPRFAYFPFGGGPRVCMGQHYAMMQMALVLSVLVQDLELEALSEFTLQLEPVLTLRPVGGQLPMRVRRRTTGDAAQSRSTPFVSA